MTAAVSRTLLLLTLLAAAAVSPARALTSIPRNLDQLVARAETIFRGVATARQAAWKGEGAERHIVTRVTFRVDETLKGPAQPEQTLEFFGGELDGKGMGISDMPTFVPGDEAILFVEGNGVQFCPLVGADQGGFRVTRAKGSDIERVVGINGKGIASAEAIGKNRDIAGDTARRPRAADSLTLAEFHAAVVERVTRQRQGLLRVQD